MNKDVQKRFLKAQESSYPIALKEIKRGKLMLKCAIPYVFPKLKAQAKDEIAMPYGIKDIDEAKQYLENDILRERLIEISETLLSVNDTAENIFGSANAMEVQSCMTLFHEADPSIEVFKMVIDKFYDGKYDDTTLWLISEKRKYGML